MIHDASPSRSARNQGTPAADAALNEANVDSPSSSPSRSGSRQRRKRRTKRKRNRGLAKKLMFVTHLLKTLDLVAFAELSALYYMECSMFRFLVRAVGHFMYLTPKEESFPFYMPTTRVHVMLVFIPNLVCILLHLFGPLPAGPDFHRGYQHGGLIIDFVGQRPPTYRLYYLLADIVICALQCLMLTVHTQREELRLALRKFRPLLPELAQDLPTPRSVDDLDAEEQGIAQSVLDETGGIELQSLNRSREGGEGSAQAEDSASLLRDASSDDGGTHLSDIMASGNAILGEYHVARSTWSATVDLEGTTARSLRTISYGATMAALQARRRGQA